MKRTSLSDWAEENGMEYSDARDMYKEGYFIRMYEDELGEVWVYTEEESDIAPEGTYTNTNDQELRLTRLSSIFNSIIEEEIKVFRADRMNEMNQYKNRFLGISSGDLCVKPSHIKKAVSIYYKIYTNQ